MGPFKNEWTLADVEAVIARGEPMDLLYVPIVLGLNAPAFDRAWVERVCFQLAEHPDFNVRGNAVLGLAHIARTCRQLDTLTAVPLIAKALADPHAYVRAHAADAAADLETFLGVRVPAR
jgi:HEAT repeats